MTDFLDSGTISGATGLSATETQALVDSATLSNAVTISSIEFFAPTDAATVNPKTSLTSIDAAAYIDAQTVESFSRPSAIITEFINIYTFDFNWNSWNAGYSYDSGITPIAGSVGSNDDDNGHIL